MDILLSSIFSNIKRSKFPKEASITVSIESKKVSNSLRSYMKLMFPTTANINNNNTYNKKKLIKS